MNINNGFNDIQLFELIEKVNEKIKEKKQECIEKVASEIISQIKEDAINILENRSENRFLLVKIKSIDTVIFDYKEFCSEIIKHFEKIGICSFEPSAGEGYYYFNFCYEKQAISSKFTQRDLLLSFLNEVCNQTDFVLKNRAFTIIENVLRISGLKIEKPITSKDDLRKELKNYTIFKLEKLKNK